MNKFSFVAFLSLLLCSCSMEEPEKDPNLLSEWKLIEIYQEDQEKYQPTDRKESLEFYADSKVERSIPWCGKHNTKVAEYSDENNLISLGCDEEPRSFRYEMKGNLLFIHPESTKATVFKYKKIDRAY